MGCHVWKAWVDDNECSSWFRHVWPGVKVLGGRATNMWGTLLTELVLTEPSLLPPLSDEFWSGPVQRVLV